MITDESPVLTVSQAAQLAGMHPQTLRQYDRLGLVTPRRTLGRGRRYSRNDVARLLQVQQLAQGEGINLAGIKRILDLQEHVTVLEQRLEELLTQVQQSGRVFTAATSGDVIVVPRGRRIRRAELRVDVDHGVPGAAGAMVLWRPAPHRDQ
ncbi:helix-turn-helix transcriptional regulator [Antribacter sp. KLBMP9083]|uniref:Helix-turn-helix transcriptional regulator n=1 Tax=Antribacter soli TaxID=2910976 RepID=A0AA41QHJ4_9MICO|nr:helix-turn-helix transcriptional regulator [Antribacter soli]MCF4123248.1 helix-turn-helix transcriptional regulator [Antribacter soli]